VIDVPPGLVEFTESSPVATELTAIGVPLPVVFDRQADLRQCKVNARNDFDVPHDPVLGDNRRSGEMKVHPKDRLRWRLRVRIAQP
jgi:hypothetical protein